MDPNPFKKKTPEQAAAAALEEVGAGPQETTKTISFQEWCETLLREKAAFVKATGKKPNGVILGQVEGQLVKRHIGELRKRKLVTFAPPSGLILAEMRVIGTDRQFGIVPLYFREETFTKNPYIS